MRFVVIVVVVVGERGIVYWEVIEEVGHEYDLLRGLCELLISLPCSFRLRYPQTFQSLQ